MTELASLLAQRLEGLASDADELREITQSLGVEMQLLPFETLEHLRTAIDTHLLRRESPRTRPSSAARRPMPPPLVAPIAPVPLRDAVGPPMPIELRSEPLEGTPPEQL